MMALLSRLLAAAACCATVQGTQVSEPELDPGDDQVPAWELDWQAGRREASVDALQLELSSADDDGFLALLLAERQIQLHRFFAALDTAESLGAPARSIRARAHYLLGHFEQAVMELDPADPVETLMLIDCHEVLGHGKQTIAALAAARAILGDGDPALAAAEGRAAARSDDHAAAVVAFRRALATDPHEHMALFGLGRSLLQLGERDEAAAVLTRHRALVPLMDQRDQAMRAIELGPLHAPNHALLADTERAIGRLDVAEQHYVRAAVLATPSERTPVALRHARLLADDRGDVPAAVALLDNVARSVVDARLQIRAGDLLLSAGRTRAALAHYEAGLQLRPNDSAIRERRDRALDAAKSDSMDPAAGPPDDPP